MTLHPETILVLALDTLLLATLIYVIIQYRRFGRVNKWQALDPEVTIGEELRKELNEKV